MQREAEAKNPVVVRIEQDEEEIKEELRKKQQERLEERKR